MFQLTLACDVHTKALELKCLKKADHEAMQNEKKVRILQEYEGEFQNHKMIEVCRDIWGSFASTSLLKARSTTVGC